MTRPVHVTNAEAGSPEWHAARSKGLGGSEIGAVLGLSPFESRFGLYHRKAGLLGPVEETDAMYWGKTLEPVIRDEFERRHEHLYVTATPGMYRHADRPWQIANPDAFLHRDFGDGALMPPHSILECKLSLYGDGWGADGTDEIPPHVRCQALWYADVFNLETVQVAVLIAMGLDYRTYEVRAEPGELEHLREAGELFLAQVAEGIRPDIDDHSATATVIRELHPNIDGHAVDVDEDLALRFAAARTLLKGAEATERKVRSELADLLGDAHKGVFDGHTIATRQARNGGTPYLVAGRRLTDLLDPQTTHMTDPPVPTPTYEPLPGDEPF